MEDSIWKELGERTGANCQGAGVVIDLHCEHDDTVCTSNVRVLIVCHRE